jgi:hypothetical protein
LISSAITQFLSSARLVDPFAGKRACRVDPTPRHKTAPNRFIVSTLRTISTSKNTIGANTRRGLNDSFRYTANQRKTQSNWRCSGLDWEM